MTNGAAITTDYLSNYIYENGNLQFFHTPEGYVEPINASNYALLFRHTFQYKDHLGNIRLSYKDLNQNTGAISLSIVEEHNYYPFGLKHNGYNGGSNGQRHHKYMFGGKELQDEIVGSNSFEVYDFGARNYDAALGRWMNLDPLAEKMRRHSPYNYAFNNPIYFIDPDGMAPQSPGPISPLGPLPLAFIVSKNWDNLKNSWNKFVDKISKYESSFGGAQGNSKNGDNSIQRKTKDDITTYDADVIINSAPSGNGKNLKGNGLENSVKKITNNITKLKAAGEKINKVNEGLEIAGKSVDQATEAISEITERFPSRVEVTNNDNGGETKIGILKDSTVSLPESQHADFKKSAKEARESIFERMPNN